MISKGEGEIESLQKQISDCGEYDKICKQKREQLKTTSEVLDDILSQGEISNTNLRMLVKRVNIHQNEDKSIDIRFDMNGDFNGSASVFIENEGEEIA